MTALGMITSKRKNSIIIMIIMMVITIMRIITVILIIMSTITKNQLSQLVEETLFKSVRANI